MRLWLRRTTNALLGLLGVRVVSARWGPRGVFDSLRRAGSQGVIPRQIVDVGASNGIWTRECLQVFPNARYLLIDPLAANAAPLTALAAEHPNISVWRGALGSAPGVLDLFEHGDQSSFLSSDRFAARATQRVEVRTLDSFLDTDLLRPPDLIKADVQGFERAVLEGATASLATTQLLLLEVSFRRVYKDLPLAHELIAFAGERGFRIYDICTYLGRQSDGELMQSDFLFAPVASPLFADESAF